MDKCIGKDKKNRKLYEGRKGGIYYFRESGRKAYVNKADIKRKSITKAKRRTDDYDDYDDEKNMDKFIGEDYKNRKLYQGRNSGIYYYTESEKKSYVNKFDIKFAKSTKAKRRAKSRDDDDINRKLRNNIRSNGNSICRLFQLYSIRILFQLYIQPCFRFIGWLRNFLPYIKSKRRTSYNKLYLNNYENINASKEKPKPVNPSNTKLRKQRWPRWFDGDKVGTVSVEITGGSIPEGKKTNANDTRRANQKRWPIAISAKLIIKDSKETLIQTVVPNPLPLRIRDKGDAGHLVAYTLGGDTDDSNIIPQNPTINEQLGYPWRDFEEKVRKIVKENKTKKKYIYIVTPMYGNVEALDEL